jgi:hypothetical protein
MRIPVAKRPIFKACGVGLNALEHALVLPELIWFCRASISFWNCKTYRP